MSVARLIATLAVVGAVSGCVGPATTSADYGEKAAHSADEAASALQTALFAARLSGDGKMLDNYLEVTLRRAEDDFGSIQQQFDSIQPPDTPTADGLRDRLDTLLTKGSSAVSELRISSRRDDQAAMLRAAASIPPIVQKLTKFAEAAT
jgi:hypothetical protein